MTTEARTYDVADVRRQLAALKDVTYMNSGTEGIMAEPVREAFFEVLTRFERYGHWARMELVDQMTLCRQRFATLLNAEPDEVCVTRNGTDGVSLILGSYPFKEGDELIIGGEEHPAITYPAFALQTFKGIRVRRFAFHHDPAKTFEAFKAELSDRTVMVAFSHVSCETGTRTPAKQIIDAAHARGVQVLLDGAQSVGAFPVDFKALNCDYLTGSAHKWLCGPKGTGVLVIRKDRLDSVVPAYVGGGSLGGDFPYAQLTDPESIRVQFAPNAAKFEYGMRNPAIYHGLVKAIDYLNELGWDAIAAHEREMAGRLKRRLAEIPGVRVQTPMAWEHSSAIVNLAVDGVPGKELSKHFWDKYQIVQRAVRDPDGVRISNAYFAADQDHDRLIEAIKSAQTR
jgi:selenocysteine lyase/cysteine desulfurase